MTTLRPEVKAKIEAGIKEYWDNQDAIGEIPTHSTAMNESIAPWAEQAEALAGGFKELLASANSYYTDSKIINNANKALAAYEEFLKGKR